MKKMVAVLLAGVSLSVAPVALAADAVKLTGDVSLNYERDAAEGDSKTSGSMYTLKIKGESDLGDGWTLYARLGAQYATQPALADFNTDAYTDGKKTAVALDQFGLTYKNDAFTYKVGRQAASVGTTSLLYSRPETNVGKKAFVDGLSVCGAVGAVDLTVLLAQEDNLGQEDNRVYAIRAGYNPTDKLNLGLTLGRYQDRTNGDSSHVALDGTYKFGKSTMTGEYTKSNISVDNKAYAATLNYGFDDKTAIYITSFGVETNGDMGKQSDFDNDNKGIYYGMTHKLSENDCLEIIYKNQKVISSGQKNTKFEATYTYSF